MTPCFKISSCLKCSVGELYSYDWKIFDKKQEYLPNTVLYLIIVPYSIVSSLSIEN